MTRYRIKKGREDEGLLRFFPEGFIILDEAHVPIADQYAKVNEKGTMFRVQAPHGSSVRAYETNGLSATYLNSGDCFTAFTPGFGEAFVWQGRGGNEVEVTGSHRLTKAFTQEPAKTSDEKEGSESDAFWSALGGKADYSSVKDTGIPAGFEPRLFSVSNSSGDTFMKEVVGFTQEDLFNEDVYILDCYDTIHIWIGNQSNKFERKGALTRADKYLDGVQDDRDKDMVAINEVYAGREPAHFISQFVQWEPELAEMWLQIDPDFIAAKEAEAQKAVEEAKANQTDDDKISERFQGYSDPRTTKFPYSELKGKFPAGVRGDSNEYYLSEEEFKSILGMTVAEWRELKTWRQQNKKKEVGLF